MCSAESLYQEEKLTRTEATLTLRQTETSCEGGLEYHYSSPESRKRRQKGNPVSNSTLRYGLKAISVERKKIGHGFPKEV
jgi:hypothetical protein